MIKRTVSFLCAFCVLLTLVFTVVPVQAGETAMRSSKIVSVVYDDSGSMKGNRWVYANYATQALIALLDTSDELYLTYMSQPTKAHKQSMDNLEDVVKQVRKWNNSSGTPGESLDTAKTKLDSLSVSDPSAQFWLVVMTDGDIGFTENGMTLQKKLDSFKGAKMSNGTSLNVCYLRMGASDAGVTQDKQGGLYTFSSDNNDTICSTIFDMASLISGRMDVDNLTQVDSKTISFTSKLPLHAISVLSQQTDAKVVSASADGVPLDIDRNIALDASDPFQSTRTTVFGNASVLNKKGAVIPKGTYTVVFSKDVELKDLLVQYEPAIGLKLDIFRGAEEITDPSVLLKEDKINISLTPVVAGTDTPISIGDLPQGISWSIEYIVDGNLMESGKGPELSDVQLHPGQNVVRGSLQLPGYAPMVIEVTFDVPHIVYHFGMTVDQPQPLSYLRGDLGAGSEQGGDVVFHVTNDGVPLTKEEVDNLNLKVTITAVSCDDSNVTGFWHRFGKMPVECKIRKNDDGSFSLIPKETVPFTAFLLKAGDYTVDVVLSADSTVTAQGQFTVVPRLSDWGDLPFVLLFLLILAYIIHLILKPKFHGETVNYKLYKMLGNGRGVEQTSDWKKLRMMPSMFSIFRPSSIKFYDLKLVAQRDRVIIVTDRSIAKQVYSYGMDSGDPEDDLFQIANNLTEVEQPDGTRVASELALSGTNEAQRLWFKNAQADNLVWCIYLDE